ncbi:hypothetical protein ACOME3_000513 [Neoechinorhynchus agilis]
MSLFPISRYRRNFFDFDNLFGPALDLFDPFDDYDLSLRPSVRPSLFWINEPPTLLDVHGRRRPRPEKFRVTLNVQGFDKKDLKTEIINGRLVISARRHDKCNKTGDFDSREFQKSFEVPKNAIADQMTSFVTGGGVLVVEIPLKMEERDVKPSGGHGQVGLFDFDEFFNSNFFPKVVDTPDGKKKIEMNVDVSSFKPNDVQVSLKDNELVVKAEHSTQQSEDGKQGFSRSYYYKQVTLPPGTDVEHLTSHFSGGKLVLEAPYVAQLKEDEGHKKIEGIFTEIVIHFNILAIDVVLKECFERVANNLKGPLVKAMSVVKDLLTDVIQFE